MIAFLIKTQGILLSWLSSWVSLFHFIDLRRNCILEGGDNFPLLGKCNKGNFNVKMSVLDKNDIA